MGSVVTIEEGLARVNSAEERNSAEKA
jgi:hypothetical protein